jgi:glycosyltransferase involved in cell wall biosynthesis
MSPATPCNKTKICIIIPAYNSATTISGLLATLLPFTGNIITVDDGSTDGTTEILKNSTQIELITYPRNRGKGHALKQGFRHAIALGYTHAITMDADGQHLAIDIPRLTQKASENPNAIILGVRQFNNSNIPKSSRFANRFSNFWFTVQTAKKIPDTQCGYRVYPLRRIAAIQPYTRRYEAELEILVRSAWRGIQLIPNEINVYYPPQNQRLTHFRSGRDFTRIALLNTILTLLAILYGHPATLLRKILR